MLPEKETFMTLVSDHMNTVNPDPADPIPADRVWEMLKAIDIAMLVTSASDGLRGRPMSTIPTPEKGVIYILTETSSTAARDIRVDGQVFLSYQGRGDHVALRGTARVNPDKGLVKDLWNPGAQIFWPNGPEAHDVVTLEIDPGHADVWNGDGLLVGIANIIRGAITGKSPDLGARGEVDL
jgi:general stress protein 26